jgi:hypothetical protein
LVEACVHARLSADSFAYFGETADGNTAEPARTAAVEAAVVVADAGAALAPHSALRKAFQVMPFNAPLVSACLYFTLHSCIVSACAGPIDATIMPVAALANIRRVRIPIAFSFASRDASLPINDCGRSVSVKTLTSAKGGRQSGGADRPCHGVRDAVSCGL